MIPQREYFDKSIANSDNTDGYYIIEQGDFVYNPRKSSDAPYGPVSIYKYPEHGIVSPLYLCFRALNPVISSFYNYFFKSPSWHRYIYLSGDSGARHDRVSIKDEVFFSMPVNIPTEEEQLKIASFLGLIEEKIALQQDLVDNLKKYKRGLLDAVFNQKIHVTNDDEEWQECRIGDILKILHGRDYKDYQAPNGEYPVLGTGGIIDHATKYLCDWPCVLIGRKGTIDKPQYMDKPFWTVDTLFYSKPESLHNPKFQYYLFQTINWKKYNEASGVPSQSSSTIEGIVVVVPNYKTQETIADLFTRLDEIGRAHV